MEGRAFGLLGLRPEGVEEDEPLGDCLVLRNAWCHGLAILPWGNVLTEEEIISTVLKSLIELLRR